MAEKLFSKRSFSSIMSKRVIVGGVSSVTAIAVATAGTSAYTSMQSSNVTFDQSAPSTNHQSSQASNGQAENLKSPGNNISGDFNAKAYKDTETVTTNGDGPETVERHVSSNNNGTKSSVDIKVSSNGHSSSSVSSSSSSKITVNSNLHSSSKRSVD